MESIQLFAYGARNEIVNTIIQLPIIVPNLEFDYSNNPNINQGYYMYKKPVNTIVLNMVAIEALKDINAMKTVIVYGIIHETVHMFQEIESRYFKDKRYYTFIEDVADYTAITIMQKNYDLIERLLSFSINISFINGIKRQLEYKILANMYTNKGYSMHIYYSNIICDAICKKINITRDELMYLILNTDELTISLYKGNCIVYFVCIKDDWSSSNQQLLKMINLLIINDFKLIKINTDEIECINLKRSTELILY